MMIPQMSASIDIVLTLRICYMLAAAAILVVYAIPPLRQRFLVYGPRSTPAGTKRTSEEKDFPFDRLLDYLASFKVPHSWFKHFYMVSVVSSMVWLQQLYTRGPVVQKILLATSMDRSSMSFNQIVLCWTLLAVQGSRRLYESIVLAGPSKSEMWIGHYVLGILYYFAMGVAIWIEGAPALMSTDKPLGDAAISAPSLSSFVFLPLFLFASGIQYDTHAYLNSLRKYGQPIHPAFENIVSPHYTAECAIYLSLMFLAAPKGQIINQTILAALVFVVIELGVSADISKRWYKQKFGGQLVQHKWRMIPGVW